MPPKQAFPVLGFVARTGLPSRIGCRLFGTSVALSAALLLVAQSTDAEARGGGGGRGGAKSSGSSTFVTGHVRSNGSYVPGHFRSAPDGTKSNYWSTVGNVNPYTGAPGTLYQFGPNSRGSAGAGYVPSTPSAGVAPKSVPSYGTGYSPGYVSRPAPTYAPSYAPSYVPSSRYVPGYGAAGAPPQDTYRPNVVPQTSVRWGSEPVPPSGAAAASDPTYPREAAASNSARLAVMPAWTTALAVAVPQPQAEPAQQALPAVSAGAQCPWGHRAYGQVCVPLLAPENARLSADGADFECFSSYRRYGNKRVPLIDTTVQVPLN